jgi:hypothetical protein
MVFAPKQLTSKLVDKQSLGQINMLITKCTNKGQKVHYPDNRYIDFPSAACGL